MWNGILKILEIQQWRDDQVIWEARNINNLLHLEGEEFLLRAAFTGGQSSTVIPVNYYLGLENRSTLSIEDTLNTLLTEPSTNGYTRQIVHSSGDFTAVVNQVTGHWQAVSPIVAFRASGGNWGPVQNLFLCTSVDNSGLLISSVRLPTAITVTAGDQVTMRMAITLRDCPPA